MLHPLKSSYQLLKSRNLQVTLVFTSLQVFVESLSALLFLWMSIGKEQTRGMLVATTLTQSLNYSFQLSFPQSDWKKIGWVVRNRIEFFPRMVLWYKQLFYSYLFNYPVLIEEALLSIKLLDCLHDIVFFLPFPSTHFSPTRSFLPLISTLTSFQDWGLVTRQAQLLITTNTNPAHTNIKVRRGQNSFTTWMDVLMKDIQGKKEKESEKGTALCGIQTHCFILATSILDAVGWFTSGNYGSTWMMCF